MSALRELVHIMINPMVWFVVVLVLVAAYTIKRSRHKMLTIAAAFVIITPLYLITTSPVANFFTAWLERQYPPFYLSSQLQAEFSNAPPDILILGSGYDYSASQSAYNQLDEAGLKRTIAGYRLAIRLPNSRIITSGYAGFGQRPVADVVKDTLVELGIEPGRIVSQTKPHNTKAEAFTYAQRFAEDNRGLILVTSATHMRRAVGWFKAAGVDSIYPAPTDYRYQAEHSEGWKDWLPDASNVQQVQIALREYIGFALVKE